MGIRYEYKKKKIKLFLLGGGKKKKKIFTAHLHFQS